ncbi:MAG TPA: UDPGP type 1 family protein [Mobilitalea sp.]|nr:UDPGP type 1 family protein [Mobilitalea sp.]
MTYEKIYETLKDHNQLQLLSYYDELNDLEKDALLEQIADIDFDLLNNIKTVGNPEERGKFDPVDTLTIEEIKHNKEHFFQIGIEAIRQGKAGAVLLAGGQGTRLGFEHPKGMLNVGISNELYIFEIHINHMLEIVNQAGAWIPLYIMTSQKNNSETIEFFEENNYFGYSKEFVFFFTQEMAPSVDYNGKIYLEEKGAVSLSPNGNGGWFSSLAKAGYLNKIKANGLEWLNVFSVDNVLQKIADPYFIGATIEAGRTSGAKVVGKAAPDEKVGVLCLEDGKPSIVEYYEMSDEMRNSRNAHGDLLYNYGVILNYLFKVSELEKIMDWALPVHVVEKKIPYINEQGDLIKPGTPNGYKFETLVLDMIHRMDSCLSFEVERNREFAPIKNKTGVDSLDSARELMKENGMAF